jgi:nucleotide-binding universal stress UspA family protein
MFRLILVPLDGTAFAEHALPASIALANGAQCGLLLAHVAGSLDDGARDPNAREEAAREYLRDVAHRVSTRTPAPVDCLVAHGDAPPALRAVAAARRADLVVMATHARGAVSRLFVGSVTQRIVREVGLPVLVVRRSDAQLEMEREVDETVLVDPVRLPSPPLRHLLVPLDGSTLGEAVLDPAVAVARAREASLTLLTVRTPRQVKEARAAPREYLERVAERLRASGLTVHVHEGEHARVAQAIVRAAIDVQADGIAMATHAREGVAELLHRAVTADVVDAVLMPVLLVHPDLGDEPA